MVQVIGFKVVVRRIIMWKRREYILGEAATFIPHF